MRLFHAALIGALAAALSAHAQQPKPIRIGVLNDMNGFTAAIAGPGSVVAANMAVADFGGKVGNRPIEILSADHQNKADVGAAIARKWFEADGVDAIVDLPNSSVALAVQEIGRTANKVVLHTAGGSSALSGKSCSPNGVQWARDSYALAQGLGTAVVKSGGDSWYFITADYAFGHASEADMSAAVTANKGKVLGSVKHPPNTGDFASQLMQAQSSRAKVIALASAGSDMSNAIKQASEFGIGKGGQKLVAITMFLTDVHSLGLPIAQGTQLLDVSYWDQNDAMRKWSQRFFEKHQRMPTAVQADVYSGVTHYLKALARGADAADGAAVVRQMKAIPVADTVVPAGKVREDGKLVRDMYLYQVKTPAESKGPWDYYKVVQKVPGEQLVIPLAESQCALVKK
jgi:branched-chain amino acid transport system substrate-binding protein